MNYTLKQYFSKDECEYIINFCMEFGEIFSYNVNELKSWDCRRIYDEGFKGNILNKFLSVNTIDSFNIKNINISLTRYYDDRWLDLHLDSTSNYTTVIVLSDSYSDGRFVLSNSKCEINLASTKLSLGLGEGVTFEGNKIYHGVMPVYSGLRCALNIWMNDTDFVYYKLDKTKKLI